MPHNILDDLTELRRLDPSGMIDLITGLPEQFSKSIDLIETTSFPNWSPDDIDHILILGMGGSAIGGDLVRSYLAGTLSLPIQVVRDYALPSFAAGRTQIIASSYSGNTEETLAAVDEASSRGCRIIALSSGGQLAGMAAANKWPLIQLPQGFPPRAALGYSFSSLLLTMGGIGLIENPAPKLRELAKFLDSRTAKMSPEIPLADNKAKQLALKIQGRIPAIYGAAGMMAVAALRWKGQICENAENLALAGEAPEFNHNEVVGWGSPPEMIDYVLAVFLQSNDDHPRLTRRFDIVRRLFAKKGTPVEVVTASGDDPLQRLFSIIQFGDWVSLYLAFLNGVDPTTITAINHLKSELGRASD